MRYKIAGSCGEKHEINVDFGFIEAENGTEAVDILWRQLQKTDIVTVKSKEDLNSYFSIAPCPILSEPYQIIQKIYRKSWESGGQSYIRLNAALQLGMQAVITAGLLFDLNDIREIASTFRSRYWFSDDDGEWIFKTAVKENNLSACLSFEDYKGRKPFILEGKRMYVGRQFYWYDKDGKGYYVTCTSFAENGDYFTACSYKSTDSYRSKIDKRFKITWDDLAGKREAIQSQKKKALKK